MSPAPRRRASTPLVPRLHVIMRPAAARAVIFRSGPTRTTATFGWDLDTDEIQLGQWVRARILTFDADLSPDGARLYYEAYDGDNEDLTTEGWYRCVSRAPYLKAVKYWSGRRPLRASRLFDDAGQLRSGTYVERLEREGWQMIDDQVGATRLRKPIRAHVMLEKTIHRAEVSVSYPRRHDRHRLIARGGRVLDVDWDWADLHGDRLLWTARGVLHTSRSVGPDGAIRDARVLHDFTGLRFQRVKAPY